MLIQKKSKNIQILMLVLALWPAGGAMADDDDFNDGISAGDIAHSDSIKPDRSINYIKRNAKSDAVMQAKRAIDGLKEDNVGLQGSAYVKEGAVVDGDITIIYEGDGNSVVVD
jgi:hypothetical protein